jgi:hypothetical protein
MKTLKLFILLLFGFGILTFGQQNESNESKVIFYRTKRFAGSSVNFIVGSSKPDTVFTKLKNGTYHTLLIKDFREWEFVWGTLKVTANQKLNIEPGKTYYIHCFLKSSFPADKGCFELVDEKTAQKDMMELEVRDKWYND